MLETEFMRLALGAGAIVGVLAPAVGFFLVQRRQSLTGDGIGHVAFAGVAAGILLDVSPVLTALVAAVLGGVAIELLRSRGGTAGDQALALVFYTGIALGVVLVAPAGALNVLLAALAAVTVSLSMRVVGILLVAALMVLPVSAAGRIAWSMRSTLVLSMLVGLGAALAGLTLSYYADLPPGGTIVLVAAGAFAVCALVGALRGR
jgi:zinc transport system permease protein